MTTRIAPVQGSRGRATQRETGETIGLPVPLSGLARASVGYSELPHSREAGIAAATQALAGLGDGKCDLVLLFSTSKHDPSALHEAVRSVIGPSPRLIGGYSVGIITHDRLGYAGHQVGVAALSLPGITVDTYIEPGLPNNESSTGRSLSRQIRSREYTAESAVVLMYDSVNARTDQVVSLNLATPFLQGLLQGLRQVPPIAGAGLVGDMAFNPTYQWFDERVVQGAAMALVLSGSVRMDTIVMHGCKPASGYHTITKAEGTTILEIDGKPALDMVTELLGPDCEVTWEEYPLFLTLGVNRGDLFGEFREEDYANRVCMAVDRERRALVMFEPDLTEGTEVQLMRRSVEFEYVGERAEELLARLEGRRPFFALYFDCAGRTALYCGSEREEAEEVQRVIGVRMPLLGIYTGVEIAKMGDVIQPLDWTGVLCVFSEEVPEPR
jgi:hypothetical protein